MKYCLFIVLFIYSSVAQASYCSGKNWNDTYQLYARNVDLLNYHIDRYNILLYKKISLDVDNDSDKGKYLIARLAIEELDQLSVDVENLDIKFDRVKQFWQLISEDCLGDDELEYNNKAIENAHGADIGRREVNDLLARISFLRDHFFKIIKLVNDHQHAISLPL